MMKRRWFSFLLVLCLVVACLPVQAFAYTVGMTPMNVSLVDGSLTVEEMTYEEIMHLARTCSTTQGGAYYAKRAEQIAFRNLIAPIAEDLEKVWRRGSKS